MHLQRGSLSCVLQLHYVCVLGGGWEEEMNFGADSEFAMKVAHCGDNSSSPGGL